MTPVQSGASPADYKELGVGASVSAPLPLAHLAVPFRLPPCNPRKRVPATIDTIADRT